MVSDPFVEGFLGVYGNKYFNRLIYAFEFNLDKVELVGILPYNDSNIMKLKMWGFKDLTDKFEQLYGRKPTEIDLLKSDITYLVDIDRKLKLRIRKLLKL